MQHTPIRHGEIRKHMESDWAVANVGVSCPLCGHVNCLPLLLTTTELIIYEQECSSCKRTPWGWQWKRSMKKSKLYYGQTYHAEYIEKCYLVAK